MQVDTVLFEFERVLADTEEPRRGALQRSLAEEGIELSDAEYARVAAGFPPREGAIAAAGLHKAGIDDTALELVALRAERYFAEAIGKGVALAAGVRSLVEDLQPHARLAIVTRASRREVDFVLGLAGLDTAFEVIVTREDVLTPKPSPEGYERAMQRLVRRRRVSRPTQSLALEDSAAGVLAARAMKIAVIGVGPMQTQYGAEPDAHLDSLAGQTLASLTTLVERMETR